VVPNTLLVLAALAGVAGQLVTGTDRALSGVIAALPAPVAAAVTAFEGLVVSRSCASFYNDAELNLEEAEICWDATGPEGDLAAELERVEEISGPRMDTGATGRRRHPKGAPTGPDGQ
jgi:hypothetical protein